MTREAICTGKTVEEALEKAYAELGATSDNSEFEIIERPKRSLFGLRVTPAKVRVFMEVAEPKKQERPEPKPAAPEAAPKAQPPRPQRPQGGKPQEKTEEKPQPAAKSPAPKPAEPPAPPKEITEESHAKVLCAAEYLRAIFRDMGLGQVELGISETGSGAIFTLSGEGLGVLIGRRGETLDALQYLSGLVANRLEGDYFRVTIDSGNYREKREHTLEQLAKKLSSQVARTGRNMTLEPMNPYERRIIHATVQNIEGVSSSSIGEEPNRRVVISSTNPRRRNPPRSGGQSNGKPGERPDQRPDRNNRGVRNDRGGRGGRGGKPQDSRQGPGNITTRPNAFGQKPAGGHIDDSAYEVEPPVRAQRPQAPAPAVESAPKSAPPAEVRDRPLYSKIDLDD